jgi:hypothetical protein
LESFTYTFPGAGCAIAAAGAFVSPRASTRIEALARRQWSSTPGAPSPLTALTAAWSVNSQRLGAPALQGTVQLRWLFPAAAWPTSVAEKFCVPAGAVSVPPSALRSKPPLLIPVSGTVASEIDTVTLALPPGAIVAGALRVTCAVVLSFVE